MRKYINFSGHTLLFQKGRGEIEERKGRKKGEVTWIYSWTISKRKRKRKR